MLVLTRRIEEAIVIGEHGEVVVRVLGILGGKVRLGVEAARQIPVHRGEIYREITSGGKSSVASGA